MKMKGTLVGGFYAILILISLGLIQPDLVLALETGYSSDTPSPLPRLLMPDGNGGVASKEKKSRQVDLTDRLIVKFKDPVLGKAAALRPEFVRAFGARGGVALNHLRVMSGNNQVFKLPRRMKLDEAQGIAKKLSQDPDVEYAVPDRLMFPMQVPNDTSYASQWHYKSPDLDNERAGINLPPAWDVTTGSSSVVVGVIDTGIVNHADLQGRVLPGYNFVSDPVMAGNGVGRTSDASDLGDWVTSQESSDPSSGLCGCYVTNSSWHGTHVAGTIGAASNNGTGVTGINWSSKILPVRVLGKCGGYWSDIIDGMRWAAGLSVPGVPANPNPAKVLSMSLGGGGACDAVIQDAINEIVAAGVTIVVAAGNSGLDLFSTDFTPAVCKDVITVAAVNRDGGVASYSNYGQILKIAAPGGQQSSAGDPNGVLSTLNSGTTSPVPSPSGDTYGYYQGTSMATPHVTGVVSLMLSVNPALTPAQVLGVLQATARPFSATGYSFRCTTSTCGAGIADAYQAVRSVNAGETLIGATPLNLTFTTRLGEPNPPSQTIAITNTGGGALNWSTSSNQPWLHVTPASGQAGGAVSVSVDAAGLSPERTHTGSITISADGTGNSPVTIPVTLKFWLKLNAPIPIAVGGHAQAAVNGKVYVIGGWPAFFYSAESVGNRVHIYDTVSDSWAMGTQKPTPAYNMNAAVIGGKIYVPGGRSTTSYAFLNTLDIYDPVTDQWSAGAPLPTPLSESAVEAVNGKLYVVGGYDGQNYSTLGYVYDPATNAWSRIADTQPWWRGSSAALFGKIYAFHEYLTQVYDPGVNSWSAVGPLNDHRSGHAGAAAGAKVYAIAGIDLAGNRPQWLQDAEAFDPVAKIWNRTSLLLNAPRSNIKASTVGNNIYIMGGDQPVGGGWGVHSNTNESYAIDTPPTVTDFSIPATSASLQIPIVAFSTTDDIGVTGYMVTESSTQPTATAAGWTATVPNSYAFTTAGAKRLYAWAKDDAGNVSSSMSAGTTIDMMPPVVTASPKGGNLNFYASFTVTLSANEPAGIFYTVDGSTPTTSSAPYSGAISITKTTTLRFFGVDTAGNPSAVQSETYTFDTIAPGAPTLSNVAGLKTGVGLTLKWKAAADNTGGSGIASYDVFRSTTIGGTYTKVNTTPIPATQLTYTDSAITASTSYYYYIKAVDMGGNVSAASAVKSGKDR